METAISMPLIFGFEIVHKYNFLPDARGVRRVSVENSTPQFEGLGGLKWVIRFTPCLAIFLCNCGANF
jgi:hypothetical protein